MKEFKAKIYFLNLKSNGRCEIAILFQRKKELYITSNC